MGCNPRFFLTTLRNKGWDKIMKDKGYLYLPVEVKVRESDAKLLLAYYAARVGYRVVIGEHQMVGAASEVYPKGIFFSKGYPRSLRHRMIMKAKNNGHIVVELDEEGLIFNDTTHYLQDRMNSNTLKLVTQEYCWGNLQKEVIAKAYPNLHKKCHVVGHPRFDLLKPKFNPLYQDEAEQINKKYGPFILINTRFSTYNFLNKKKVKNQDAFTQYIKKLYDHFIELVTILGNKYPETNLVVRPHPSENFHSYRHAFSTYKNVQVIHEGNIIKWLKATEVVIHNGCTSSIEAFLLGKPIISYMPVTSSKYDVQLPNNLGVMATSAEEVLGALENISNSTVHENDEQQTLENSNALSTYYESMDSGYSYENILRLLQTITSPTLPSTFSPPTKTINMRDNDIVKHFFSLLSKKEIQRFFTKLDKIENTTSHMIIKQLGKNLFEIQTK